MSVGKALKDFRLGTLRGKDGQPVKTAKDAVKIGREQEITAAEAGAALARSKE